MVQVGNIHSGPRIGAMTSVEEPRIEGVTPRLSPVGPQAPEAPVRGNAPAAALEALLGEMTRTWKATEYTLASKAKLLPAPMKNLYELQRSVHQLHLQSEFITRAAEAATAVIRKAQQSGGS